MAYVDYTDKDVSMKKWLEEIAPKYFDFDASELYMTSQFGYMNEVMGTVENDTHHAVSIARREFYPTTAHYLSSFYKMAALQQISYPLANPATATAILILKESDILLYGQENPETKVKEFVLDNSTVFYASNIPFMLDYPIKIIVKNVITNSSNVSSIKNAYTARYLSNVNKKNSLSKSYNKYIKSRVYRRGSETLLLLKVVLRQCQITRFSRSINTSPLISNISLDFNVGKHMCNFEAFYSDAYKDIQYQLTKIPTNSNPIREPFCEWQMYNDSTLRIVFPNNPYFNPTYNSDLEVEVYTTMGDDGNFDRYDGPLTCITQSEKYPYNSAIKMSGKIIGSSVGGYSMPALDDFKNEVIAAYATNKTYTTDSDLQVMFDKTARTTRNRIIFSKRRDDCFERMYGAYTLLKDANGYVIPTNSLTCEFNLNDVETTDAYGNVHSKIGFTNGDETFIKAGVVWRYHDRTATETLNEPEFATNDDGSYYITEDASGNIPNGVVEDILKYYQVTYLYVETDEIDPETGLKIVVPVWQTYADGTYIPTKNKYSYFKLMDDGEYQYTTSNIPVYLIYNEATGKYEQKALEEPPEPPIGGLANITLTRENHKIDESLSDDDPDVEYYIQDYGILQKSIYADGRNKVINDPVNRAFMIFPEPEMNLTTVDTLDAEEIRNIFKLRFTYYYTIASAGWDPEEQHDYEYEDYLNALEICKQYNIEGDNIEDAINDAANKYADTIYDNYAFINPFLIRHHSISGVSAYYRNTFNNVYPLDLVYAEDASVLQFSTSGLTVERNAIFGENFYKLTISIQPSITDFSLSEILRVTDNAAKDPIQAPFDGIVDRFVYIPTLQPTTGDQVYAGHVYMLIKFFLGDGYSHFPDDMAYTEDASVQAYIDANYPYAASEHTVIKAIRIGSSVHYEQVNGAKIFKTDLSYYTNLIAGSTIVAGNNIAVERATDAQEIRIVGMFKSEGDVKQEYYVPFIYDSYDSVNDSYNFSAYISTDDLINDKDMQHMDDGIYVARSANNDDSLYIDPEKTGMSIGIFANFENDNLTVVSLDADYAKRYNNMPYLKDYTLVNVYETLPEEPIKFLELYRFIRSTSKVQRSDYVRIDPDTLVPSTETNIYTEIREMPVIRAEWAASPGNIFDLFRLLKTNHDWISEAYDLLDNNFTINMKLFNTYGRSRYLLIGNYYTNDPTSTGSNTLYDLDSVNLQFKFGVKLRSLVDQEDFKTRFTTYIRYYVENFNSVENYGVSIYMSELYTKLNQKFKDEVLFLEFYGINNFESQRAQVIKPWAYEDINALGYNKYIPEFINIYQKKTDTIFVPTVDITFIDT
jgi:hypothetical protein